MRKAAWLLTYDCCTFSPIQDVLVCPCFVGLLTDCLTAYDLACEIGNQVPLLVPTIAHIVHFGSIVT